ncbi:hypothetical protein J7413_03395 [Shimia sp. R10_1]|uniref:hypothetical protein n=1 Tax=Shimia sp. R10_1 TaxID=2821095 RepID=UPI001ADAB9C9|nr:hypothetical protein [Shimia sp. R10_1]MBO9472573.1 hypothetical protein [Shimia sp. R10_1]
MIRYVLAFALMGTLAQAADNREEVCSQQGTVMSAIQEARLDRVRESKLEAHLLENNPGWPDSYKVAIQQFAPIVYAAKRKDLKNVDLGAQITQQCLDNWDKIQEMQKSVSN